MEPNSWLKAEFDYRVKRLNRLLWSSLHTYMNDATPREDLKEAKSLLLKFTTAAFYLHLDMTKYTAGLCFMTEDHSADARPIKSQKEEILGESPQESIRLLVSPPLYKEISHDGENTTRQVLVRGQVYSNVLERQIRTPVEQKLASVYTTRPKRVEVDPRHGRGHRSRKR